MRPPSGRAGFSLLEMVITIAIIAIMAAVVAVETTPQLPSGRAATLQSSLVNIENALNAFKGAMASYPQSITQLARHPSVLTSPVNSCGGGVTNPPASWDGPYIQQNIGDGGWKIGSSTILPTMDREPDLNDESTQNYLWIEVAGVDRNVAEIIDQRRDAGSEVGLSVGSVRWTDDTPSTPSGRGKLRWRFGIQSDC